MARRRHYRGLVRFPGLGALPSVKTPVKPIDVGLGAALGLAGSVAIKKGTDALAASGTSVPSFVSSAGPVAGGLVTAGVLYFAQRKRNKARATGHAIGAALGGLVVAAYGMLQGQGMLNGLVRFPGLGGQFFNNPRMAGFRGPILANPQTAANFGALARMQGLGDDNEDGLFPAP